MHAIFERTAVLPVLVIERVEDAVPLASALVRGGLKLMEVTFRTAAATAAIAAFFPPAAAASALRSSWPATGTTPMVSWPSTSATSVLNTRSGATPSTCAASAP